MISVLAQWETPLRSAALRKARPLEAKALLRANGKP